RDEALGFARQRLEAVEVEPAREAVVAVARGRGARLDRGRAVGLPDREVLDAMGVRDAAVADPVRITRDVVRDRPRAGQRLDVLGELLVAEHRLAEEAKAARGALAP